MAEPAVNSSNTPTMRDVMNLILKLAEDTKKFVEGLLVAGSHVEFQSETSKLKEKLILNMHESMQRVHAEIDVKLEPQMAGTDERLTESSKKS